MSDQRVRDEIVRRDEKALEKIIEKYSRLLWKVVAAILVQQDACEVEECVADVFIYLWEHPEKYEPEKGKLSAWLCMIARSRAIDRYRKLSKGREFSLESEFAERDWEEILGAEAGREETDDRVEQLRRCVALLPDEEREVILRRFFYEQKVSEIALAMGLKTKQVENRIYYCKGKLKKWMEEQHGEANELWQG